MDRLHWLLGALPPRRLWRTATGAMALLLAAAGAASADVDEKTLHLTPARVGFLEGDVSFWRPGAGDWEAATVNIPLAAGDALATRDGRVEVQVGPQSFLRAGDQTQLRVKSQEPDFLQVEITQGYAVLDLRQLPVGHVIQIDTPQGAVTTTADGFYRVDVGADSTQLTVRRAGSASFTPVGGQAVPVATGESVTLSGGIGGQLNLAAAPAFDEWDRWNYGRADAVLAAPRSYAVPTNVYGVADLDRYGGWRYVSTYGRVWVPYSVPVGWAPYTSGRWLWDPVYGYSWVDYAPWGWAPFHYGRWVYNGYWAWAPGPVVFGAVYAPALVSFFTPAVSVSVGIGVPFIGWTALSWGEPLVPWWGGVGFVGVPCWYGWGGPRVVNNIVINNYDTVNANRINVYRNAGVPGGLVGVPKHQFGGPDVQRVRLASLSSNQVKPLRGVTRTSLGTPAVPKSGLPSLSRGPSATQDVARGATQLSRQANAAGLPGAAVPPKGGGQSAAFERLRAAPLTAAREPLPQPALPRMQRGGPANGGTAAPATGATVAPPKGQGTAFDRLRAAPPAPRPQVYRQVAPASAPRAGASIGAAPPPLRGASKPQGGSATAYQTLRRGSAPVARAPVAPSAPRGISRSPGGSGRPSVARAAPPSAAAQGRVQPVVPAVPKPMAQAAPLANFAPQAKPMAMPNLSRGMASGGTAGAMGGSGGGSPGMGGLGAGGGGRPGGGMGGGRPTLSR